MIRRGREECDDGDRVNTNACTNSASSHFSDNIVRTDLDPAGLLYEACDEGNPKTMTSALSPVNVLL